MTRSSFGIATQIVLAHLSTCKALADADIKMSDNPDLPFALVSQVQARHDYVRAWAEIDIDLFTGDPGTTIDVGAHVDHHMMFLQYTQVSVNGVPVSVGRVKCDDMFSYRNYENPLLHRAMATYQLETIFNAQLLPTLEGESS